METPAYYNTNKLSGDSLVDKIRKSLNQEFWVLDVFGNYENKLTASKVHKILMRTIFVLGVKEWPITSTRRAMTNLSKRDKLKKTDDRAIGMYGSPEHYYELLTN